MKENEMDGNGMATSIKAQSDFARFFNAKCKEAHGEAVAHGWYDGGERNDGEVIALMHCELSEALQALREGNPPDKHCPEYSSLEIELADAIIRIMDYAGAKGMDIGGAIEAKMAYNTTRPYKHGRKF